MTFSLLLFSMLLLNFNFQKISFYCKYFCLFFLYLFLFYCKSYVTVGFVLLLLLCTLCKQLRPPVTYLEFRLKVYKLCTEKFYKTKMPAHCTKKTLFCGYFSVNLIVIYDKSIYNVTSKHTCYFFTAKQLYSSVAHYKHYNSK